ncbi:nitroreductase family protein [Christiangramia sabulilitoris]|uniref:Nitroreductase family protein n=1 Tax=Christiangramia sabulilitoris TaxID=2583991 RepID=A0A550I713_9FLAO|nr:nitroreductase family protein [Christiangramia sabulilitoris]TRO66759.1 nitroreductase family protein [Christiangramia sabulilitoris]
MAANEKMINGYRHIGYEAPHYTSEEMTRRSADFYKLLDSRCSVRHFSDRTVAEVVIENIIKTAGTAPSGAHKQPWKFCAVANPELKKSIRIAAEKEEEENYNSRMSERWLKDLAPLGTDTNKEFLEIAPWLIVVFKEAYEVDENGEKQNNYYVNESVGIACGLLISAIHNAGLVTLTHTPSPMNFLAELLKRPKNERAFLLLPVGYAAEDALVPDIHRKPLEEISVFYK